MNAALQSLMKGLVLAEVVDVDDPEKLGRVKVSFLTLSATEPGDWCDIARSPPAASASGCSRCPETWSWPGFWRAGSRSR